MNNLNENMSFREAIEMTKSIIRRFEKIEGKPWKAEGAMMELTKQVGELAKLIMVYEKYYFSGRSKIDKQYEVTKEKIGDELADILYAVIRIADNYEIDLIDAHLKARAGEDNFLKEKGI
jgi:NTP pyrophosphatase (non-canonical NTP hydrolase)